MLTTQFSAGLRAGPLGRRGPERDASLIWFVTDVRDNQVHSWLHRGGGLQPRFARRLLRYHRQRPSYFLGPH